MRVTPSARDAAAMESLLDLAAAAAAGLAASMSLVRTAEWAGAVMALRMEARKLGVLVFMRLVR